MADIPAFPPLEGIKDLWGLLDLVRNEKKYRTRLEALESVRDAINANLKSVGTVRQIEKLQIQVRTDRESAAQTLATAKNRAAEIIQRAKDEHTGLDEKSRQVDERAAELDRIEAKRNSEYARRDKEIDAKSAAVEAREVKVSEAEAAVKLAAKLADEAKRKYDATVADIGRVVESARMA